MQNTDNSTQALPGIVSVSTVALIKSPSLVAFMALVCTLHKNTLYPPCELPNIVRTAITAFGHISLQVGYTHALTFNHLPLDGEALASFVAHYKVIESQELLSGGSVENIMHILH